jgi:hypothetical protein
MRRTIETAPRDGNVIILEDDARGTYDVAHWSPEAGAWVGENGEPSKITPSHWYPMEGDNYLQEAHDISGSPSRAGPSASPARRYSFFFPFSLRRAARQRPTASDVIASRSVPLAAPMTVAAVEAQTAPVEAKRTPYMRRGFATSSIAATLVAAALIGTYFRAEVADYVTRYAGQQDIFRISTTSAQVLEQETQLPSQESRKTDSLALHQAEADQASAQAGTQEAAQIKQAVEASAPEARQSLEKEQRTEALANELAEARRAIDGLNLQLQAGPAKTAQLLGQEREKTAALVQDATAARQELTASTVQHRHALEEERARSAALADELAMARREIETQVALLRKAGDEPAQLKKAAESATAELRQSLQREHDRAEALASELASARRNVETQVALSSKKGDEAAQLKQAAESATAELRQSLQQEHDRAEALASELVRVRRDVETQVALSSKKGDEAAQLKQAAESATAELRQSLQREHDRAEALASELARARQDVETQTARSRKAGDQAVQFKQAAERTMAELRQSLQGERGRAEALAADLESARRTINGRVALERAVNSQIVQVKQAAEVAASEQPAAAEQQGSLEATRLMARASALLGQGNIGAARTVLQRASETGSAQASFMLAETYDPAILSAWGTYGTRGEATKAREFYAKAHAGGIQQAKDRLDALR